MEFYGSEILVYSDLITLKINFNFLCFSEASLKEWANPIDKMRMHRSFESKVRCRNCRQQGHIAKNCPVPVKSCSMCGSRKHREFKCNESCCLTVSK